MVANLVGYKVGTGKKTGNPYCMLHIVSECTAAELQSGSVGNKVETVFAPASQLNYFKPADIGKDIELNYDVVGGRAYLTSVVIL